MSLVNIRSAGATAMSVVSVPPASACRPLESVLWGVTL